MIVIKSLHGLEGYRWHDSMNKLDWFFMQLRPYKYAVVLSQYFMRCCHIWQYGIGDQYPSHSSLIVNIVNMVSIIYDVIQLKIILFLTEINFWEWVTLFIMLHWVTSKTKLFWYTKVSRWFQLVLYSSELVHHIFSLDCFVQMLSLYLSLGVLWNCDMFCFYTPTNGVEKGYIGVL